MTYRHPRPAARAEEAVLAWTESTRRPLAADAIAPTAATVEHVGSTSVAGLDAKPVPDLQVAVPDVNDEDAYRCTALYWRAEARRSSPTSSGRPSCSESGSLCWRVDDSLPQSLPHLEIGE